MYKPNGDIDWDAISTASEKQVAELCNIDLSDLIRAMRHHAALYAWVAWKFEAAKVAEVQADYDVELAKAQASNDLMTADPSMAVNRVEKLVPLQPKYRAAVRKHIEARKELAPLKALITGLDHRRDMIVQIASRQKKELES